MTDLTDRAPSTTQSGTPDTHQPTLPPEVEAAIERLTVLALPAGDKFEVLDIIASHLTAQAEEIERLENYAEGLKLGASITRRQRDRYKAMAEWLAAGAWQNYCPEFPPQEIEGVGTVVGLVVEDEDCPLGIRTDDPEHCPKCWLKAAEEAVNE